MEDKESVISRFLLSYKPRNRDAYGKKPLKGLTSPFFMES